MDIPNLHHTLSPFAVSSRARLKRLTLTTWLEGIKQLA